MLDLLYPQSPRYHRPSITSRGRGGFRQLPFDMVVISIVIVHSLCSKPAYRTLNISSITHIHTNTYTHAQTYIRTHLLSSSTSSVFLVFSELLQDIYCKVADCAPFILRIQHSHQNRLLSGRQAPHPLSCPNILGSLYSSNLNRCRYARKPSCPVRNCVR